MKTDIYTFEKSVDNIGEINDIVSNIAGYNRLDKKQELRLSLLCEELIGMLPNLLVYGNGKFWIENNGSNYEIHALVEADSKLSAEKRDELLAVSKSGKNAAAVGIMNKIKVAAEMMLAEYASSAGSAGMTFPDSHCAYMSMGRIHNASAYAYEWSLSHYKDTAKTDTEAWDELEKSIIAKLADDVTVGIISGKVEIVVKKSF